MTRRLILHLGGGINRADKAIELALKYPNTPILVSSEGGDVLKYYQDRGIDPNRVYIDRKAWDTVTNFTATLPKVKKTFNADTVFVVTHDFHMKRSMRIANAVYWMRGIKAIAAPAGGPERVEPEKYVNQDTARAWIWRLTGFLIYWKSVREKRCKAMGPSWCYDKKWNEIGI